ncbi:hypothetical protein RhiirA4_452396 [Rhizophagus irregularis]|uniref:C2H2-type domain-containing protein n=1 Tax=Rhizophagus irregularis TaxID=588596 RepID=A0A2I1FXZ4_9GLOM|nr:hypothetical protein RhiirA4_452396 [Rhizophagus irregularis]
MKILTEFSEEEDEEIGVNEDVNSKSDDACDIYINDYDNHIISEIYFIIIVEKQKNRRSLKHKYKCDQEGCESGDSDIEYNKNEDNVGTKNHACILYNKKPMNAGKLVVEENFLQNQYFNIIKKKSYLCSDPKFGKRFSQQSNLKIQIHMRTYTGEKSYKCKN